MIPCLVIPIFNHGASIGGVLKGLEDLCLPCIIVNDGSGADTLSELKRLEGEYDWLEVIHHAENRGKGAALRTAYRAAYERGSTHVVQIDADGQHASSDIPLFLEASRAQPRALVLGNPIFDDSVPWHRLHGRKISRLIVWIETFSMKIADPLCGFRVIPLSPVIEIIESHRTADRMEFDPELLIRMVRAGVPVKNIDTSVRYPDFGISHFRMREDNLLIARTYIRLAIEPFRNGLTKMRRT